MFIKNKYSSWYHNIIASATTRRKPQVSEQHHIIPRSLGGSDDADNLVDLTPREHYICHACLVRMTAGAAYKKMVFAFWAMSNRFNKRQAGRSRLYEMSRAKFISEKSESMKGERNHFYGRSHTKASRKLISENNSMHREEVREKCRGPRPNFLPHNHFTGWTDEVKQKISSSLSGRSLPLITREKMKQAKANLRWIHKDFEKPKQVKESEMELFLLQGWKKGRGPRAGWK